MLKFFVILALLASAGSVFAVEADRWEPDAKDVLNVKGGILNPIFRIRTESTAGETKNSEVDFEPTPFTKYFVGVGYRNLGATISWSGANNPEDADKYGTGTSLDLQFSAFGRNITQYYFYQNYNGYYINNTSTIDPSFPQNKYIQRPDISTRHYGANFVYNFQPERYSRAVAFDQSGRQVRSGGAWLAMLGIHNHAFSANPQLIPTQVSGKYGELATLQQADLLQANLSGGGGFTWVFNDKYSVSTEILVGYGIAYEKYESAEYTYRKTDGSLNSNLSLSVGYNGVSNYGIVQVGADAYTYHLPDMDLAMTSQRASFHYGHRFDGIDIPFLNKVSGWLD